MFEIQPSSYILYLSLLVEKMPWLICASTSSTWRFAASMEIRYEDSPTNPDGFVGKTRFFVLCRKAPNRHLRFVLLPWTFWRRTLIQLGRGQPDSMVVILWWPVGDVVIMVILITLPETNSKFTPENGWLEYKPFLLGR